MLFLLHPKLLLCHLELEWISDQTVNLYIFESIYSEIKITFSKDLIDLFHFKNIQIWTEIVHNNNSKWSS